MSKAFIWSVSAFFLCAFLSTGGHAQRAQPSKKVQHQGVVVVVPNAWTVLKGDARKAAVAAEPFVKIAPGDLVLRREKVAKATQGFIVVGVQARRALVDDVYHCGQRALERLVSREKAKGLHPNYDPKMKTEGQTAPGICTGSVRAHKSRKVLFKVAALQTKEVIVMSWGDQLSGTSIGIFNTMRESRR